MQVLNIRNCLIAVYLFTFEKFLLNFCLIEVHCCEKITLWIFHWSISDQGFHFIPNESTRKRLVKSSGVFRKYEMGTWVGSSHRRCSIKKGVLKNFSKLTGKHLCQSLFFNKVTDLRLKKKLWHRPVNFAKF